MIPFFDLKAQHTSIRAEIDAALADVFASGRFILGEQVAAFEREFAAYCGAKHAVGVGNGTEAIHLALLACGIGAGDEVITVPNTAVATIAAIEQTSARPVFVDVDLRTRALDPSQLEAAITSRTRAVVPVHLYGLPANLDPIIGIARTHGVQVIEDCAQAHGAMYRSRKSSPSPPAPLLQGEESPLPLPVGEGWGEGELKRVGTIGDLGCFSFYPTKNLGAYGDGGMVTTNDDDLADRLRLLRVYGWRERDHSVIKGINSRLDELQAAMLRVKLRHLEAWNTQRRRLAAIYTEALQNTALTLPCEPDGTQSAYHLYVVRSPQRDALRAHLKAHGVETLVHYPTPIHLQEAYSDMKHGIGSFPNAERLAREILSLPLYPELDEQMIGHVTDAINAFH